MIRNSYLFTLLFSIFQVAKGYYADGEDAYQMRTNTKREIWPHVLKEERPHLEEFLRQQNEANAKKNEQIKQSAHETQNRSNIKRRK